MELTLRTGVLFHDGQPFDADSVVANFPQRSVATEDQEGYTECESYRYSPELARSLLTEAGFGDRVKLQGRSVKRARPCNFTVKEFLARVGIELSELSREIGRTVLRHYAVSGVRQCAT
jgi:ABC-type transport system substrate-binding protein